MALRFKPMAIQTGLKQTGRRFALTCILDAIQLSPHLRNCIRGRIGAEVDDLKVVSADSKPAIRHGLNVPCPDTGFDRLNDDCAFIDCVNPVQHTLEAADQHVAIPSRVEPIQEQRGPGANCRHERNDRQIKTVMPCVRT